MSLLDDLFGARSKTDGANHFQVRYFAEHALVDEAPSRPPPNGGHNNGTIRHEQQHSPHHIANTARSRHPQAQPCQHTVAEFVAPSLPETSAVNMPNAWHDQYERSVTNIQDHIHAIAGAVAMLDGVEHKLLAIRCELERIRNANLLIDGDKVLLALQSLADYVNQAVSGVDDQCVNMLRDAKLEIRLSEIGAPDPDAEGVALTMISIEHMLNYKIKQALAEGLVAEQTPEFVDDICRIVSSNIQILTSIMLSLFASRDYTQAVTNFAARENIFPSITEQTDAQLPSPTIDRLQLQSLDSIAGADSAHLKVGRASLTELLKNVRENRTDCAI